MICNFSPIAFSIFGFNVHWYSLAYIFGIIIAYHITLYLSKREKTFSEELISDFISYAILGIIIGGRVGHVLFYDFQYYFEHPQDIIKVWQGGMSFYGGFIGVIICTYIFCIKRKIDFFKFIDLWSVSVPIGLGLGRIANFINCELPGKPTNLPWGIIGYDSLIRHPSQIYEAIMEGLILLCVMLISVKYDAYKTKGRLSGIFCTGYGLARFSSEFFREPDSYFSYLLLKNTGLNFNQYISIAMILLGISVIYIGIRNARRNSVTSI